MDGALVQALSQVPTSVLVLGISLILERIIVLGPSYSPINFFKALTLGITEKVHSQKRPNSPSQQKTAGALTIPTLLFPFLFLAFMMNQLAEFPYLFDGMLLWLCLSWTPARKDAIAMTKALKKDQKSLAKARLSPWVLRNIGTLSPMGMCKTTIEMLMLRSAKEYFAVIFYFVCLGSFFMLFYRLMMVLNHCWNPKISRYRHFGQAAQWICYLLEWLPNRLMTYTVMLLSDFKRSFALIRMANKWGNDNSLHLLAATASGLNVSLGGPVIYNNQKIRRPVIGNKQTKAPDETSVRQTVYLVEKVLLVWLLVIVLMATMYHAIVVM